MCLLSQHMYKIKINCTSEDQLSFENSKISKQMCQHLLSKLQLDNVESIILLHKTNCNSFVSKTLEFICSKEINEEQFIAFIHNMQRAGFVSKTNSKIQFIDNDGNIIFNYRFNTCLPALLKMKKRRKNKSRYSLQFLYKKESKVVHG